MNGINGDDDETSGATNELEELLAKRDELASLLRAVRHSLAVNAQPAIEEHPFLGADSKSSWLWSEKSKGLNERGREKSIELFRKFATVEGTMGFLEFSAYLEVPITLSFFSRQFIFVLLSYNENAFVHKPAHSVRKWQRNY